MNRAFFKKLKRHKPALISLFVLVIFFSSALFADFIAPYHYDNEDRNHSFAPPVKLHFFDKEGNFHLRPFIYRYQFHFDRYYRRIYKPDVSRRYPISLFVLGDEYRLFGFRCRVHLFGVEPPARLYLWGADSRGRDLFSRIVYGSRVSLSIGLVGVFVSFLIGLTIGGVAGYYGGKFDNLIMRLCEMVMMIPGFYLMLALRAAFPPNLSSVQIYLLLVFILSFIGWAGLARIIRGMTLSLKEREFVLSAKALGLSDFKIILTHILPHTLSYTIVAATLSIPGYILGESGLSFIGLGIQDPQASWGNLLSEAMNIPTIKFCPWILLPGLFILVTVMAFNLLGDGLRDALDPRTKLVLGKELR